MLWGGLFVKLPTAYYHSKRIKSANQSLGARVRTTLA